MPSISEPTVETHVPVETPDANTEVSQEPEQRVRRSGRNRQAPKRFEDYVPHEQVAFAALAEPEIELAQEKNLFAMKALHDPDTLYMWEAAKELDFSEFQKAMQKEMDAHTEKKNWKL
jgi:hypothetical protein